MAVEVLVIDTRAIDREFRNRGDVGRWSQRLRDSVYREAHNSLWYGHGVQTGEMQDLLYAESDYVAGPGCEVIVGSEAPHTVFYHEGTRRHPIDAHGYSGRFSLVIPEGVKAKRAPRNKGTKGFSHSPDEPMLRFYWENRGVIFRGPHVDHPGFGGHPFLENAKRASLARRGIV